MNASTPCLSLLGILTLLCGNLFSQEASITVQVRDPSGLPISGANLSLALRSGHQTATGRTRAAGSVTFNLPSGSNLLSVRAPGFAPHQRELALPAGEKAKLAIELQLGSESDTLGGAGRISFRPRSGWAFQTGFDFYALAQQATRFISRRSNDRLPFRDNVRPDAPIRDQGFYLTSSKAGENWGMAAALRFDAVQAEAARPSSFFRAHTSGPLDRKEFNTSVSLTARR